MAVKKMFSLVAVSCFVTLSAAPVRAESLTNLEKSQIESTAASNVDAGASKGADQSLAVMERNQISNSANPDFDASASKSGDESIVDQERDQIPH